MLYFSFALFTILFEIMTLILSAWFGAWLNCLVHVVMYSYYGLSVIPSLKKKLWFKKYITTFQLVSLFVVFFYIWLMYCYRHHILYLDLIQSPLCFRLFLVFDSKYYD